MRVSLLVLVSLLFVVAATGTERVGFREDLSHAEGWEVSKWPGITGLESITSDGRQATFTTLAGTFMTGASAAWAPTWPEWDKHAPAGLAMIVKKYPVVVDLDQFNPDGSALPIYNRSFQGLTIYDFTRGAVRELKDLRGSPVFSRADPAVMYLLQSSESAGRAQYVIRAVNFRTGVSANVADWTSNDGGGAEFGVSPYSDRLVLGLKEGRALYLIDSPDATKIAYMCDMLGDTDLYVALTRRPESPRNLTLRRDGTEVRLRWEAPSAAREIAGYHVYRSSESGRGYRRVNRARIHGCEFVEMAPPGPAFYAVAAEEHSRLEGLYSAEDHVTWLSRAVQNRERPANGESHTHGSGEPCYRVYADLEEGRLSPPLRQHFDGDCSNFRCVRVWKESPQELTGLNYRKKSCS